MKPQDTWARRSLMSGMGALAAAFAFGGRSAAAQTPATPRFSPTRHTQDEWLDKLPGQHRVVLDVTSAQGAREAMGFVGNIYSGSKSGYALEEKDLAVVVIFRHAATAFGYSDTLWAKHGKGLADFSKFTDPKATDAPKANPLNAAPRSAIDGLVKRGVQFGVCDTASHRMATSLAAGGDAEAVYKEMAANLIPASRLVPAGVIGVTRAQEYGYSLIFIG